jgi:hypothetical protein
MVNFKTFLTEVHARGGEVYEKQIQQKLSMAGLAPVDIQTAGSGHGADAQMFTKSGKAYGVEVKLSPNVFAGQKNITYGIKTGNWHWTNTDDLTEFYDEINLIDKIVLPKISKKVKDKINTINKWLKKQPRDLSQFLIKQIPFKLPGPLYLKLQKDIPDFKPELEKFPSSVDAIFANYAAKKVYYMQIGTGAGGFYYLAKDPLGLEKYGVPQFNPKTVSVRTRLKYAGSKSSSFALNTGLILSGLVPSPVSIDRDLTFLKKGLGYIK